MWRVFCVETCKYARRQAFPFGQTWIDSHGICVSSQSLASRHRNLIAPPSWWIVFPYVWRAFDEFRAIFVSSIFRWKFKLSRSCAYFVWSWKPISPHWIVEMENFDYFSRKFFRFLPLIWSSTIIHQIPFREIGTFTMGHVVNVIDFIMNERIDSNRTRSFLALTIGFLLPLLLSCWTKSNQQLESSEGQWST